MWLIYMIVVATIADYCGRHRVKSDLKRAAHKKHADILKQDPTLFSDYNQGTCDGMEHLLMEVTHEPLVYWRNRG